jgi:hypothetical protein
MTAERTVPLFVNGEGMRGGSVHPSVAGHSFLGTSATAPRYRFFSVGDRFPALWPVATSTRDCPRARAPVQTAGSPTCSDEIPVALYARRSLDGVVCSTWLRGQRIEASAPSGRLLVRGDA